MYNAFGDYLQSRYGCRVLKLTIDAGFTCPNRDGTLGTGGCIYCSPGGSASPLCGTSTDIHEQMAACRDGFARSDEKTRYIAYFQAYTGTYAPVHQLKSLYDQALSFPGVTGLMIGTRPDCLSDEILDLVASYRRDDFELWVEIGLQSSHDRSLDLLNRGHNFETVTDAVTRAASRGIDICLHVILGIPGETWHDMMDTAEVIANLPVRGVKIHHLHVISGTPLEEMYNRGSVPLLSMNEYVSVLCDFLERLPGDVLVHRIMGDREESTLVAPRWGLHKGTVQKAVDDEFIRRGTWQGFLRV